MSGKPSSDTDEPHANTERIFFNDTALHPLEEYCLVYVSQRGDLLEILGMSSEFSIPRRSIEACSASP